MLFYLFMKLYTYGGRYFGKKEGDKLWTHNGQHVGTFKGNEVYDRKGRYIGELKNGKLLTKTSKKNNTTSEFSASMSRVGHVASVDQVGVVLPLGYEDFPGPDELS